MCVCVCIYTHIYICVCERMQPFFKCSYEFHLALWSIYL